MTGQFLRLWFEYYAFMPVPAEQKKWCFFCPIRFQSLCSLPVIRSMTIIMSIGGIFDIFQTISIGIFSLKSHERVFTI